MLVLFSFSKIVIQMALSYLCNLIFYKNALGQSQQFS